MEITIINVTVLCGHHLFGLFKNYKAKSGILYMDVNTIVYFIFIISILSINSRPVFCVEISY